MINVIYYFIIILLLYIRSCAPRFKLITIRRFGICFFFFIKVLTKFYFITDLISKHNTWVNISLIMLQCWVVT